MPSILPDYQYDIFISYRHNDNLDGWVTHFVESLEKELRGTLKESLTIYFDKNPHDGLLETHHVDKSLEGKLKCLIFIPILSQTYCDPKSFAWQHEFVAFNKLSKEDSLGRDIKLGNGNVASRILPVKIHELDAEDKASIETEIGGVLRAIEFIYKEAGVNRPLSSVDNKNDNLNKTDYRNQVNKVANAIKELLGGISKPLESSDPQKRKIDELHNIGTSHARISKTKWIAGFVIILIAVLGYYSYTSLNHSEGTSDLAKSIAVMPFDDLSPNGDQDWFSDGLSEEVINSLYNIPGLQIRGRNSSFAFKNKNLTIKQYAASLNVNYVVEGSVRKFGNNLRVTVQLINAKDDIHVWSNQYDMKMGDVFLIQSEIAENIAKVLNIYLDDNERERMLNTGTKNTQAYEYFLKGKSLYHMWHDTDSDKSLWEANDWFDRALELDSTIALAYYFRSDAFSHYYDNDFDAPPSGKMPKEVSWQEYLWNLKQAIRYEKNISTRLIFEIQLKVMSDDWKGLSELGRQLPQDYRPSPFISAEEIIPFIVMTAGPDATIDILEKDILQDPQNLWLWRHYASILLYQGKLQAATIVVEKLSHMSDSDPYFSIVFLNELFKGSNRQKFDSILLKNSIIDEVSWYHNYWTGALHSNFERLADQVEQNEEPADHIGPIAINAYWQRADDKMVNYLTQRLDETFTSGKLCAEFYLQLTHQFNYYLPFDLNSAPKFKQKLLEAGIDPKLFKTLPRFTIQPE